MIAVIQGVLEKLGITDIKVELQESAYEQTVVYNITAGEASKYLIGQRGDNLSALQHIVRLVARRAIGEKNNTIYFLLDVNSYRYEKGQVLRDVAQKAAEDAKREGRPIILRRMSAYERRIIHTTLADHELVETESIGKDEERRVVVKPKQTI